MKFKLVLSFFSILFLANTVFGQKAEKIYDPKANAMEQLDNAILQAAQSDKFVLVQVGGNWCPWCHKLHHFILDKPDLDSIIEENFVLVRVNYSPENKNPEALKRLKYPQRFGFPVLCVLDSRGNLIHTQDSGYLELGKSYDKKKILRFLQNWSPKALEPDLNH